MVCCALLALTTTGCYGWVQVPPPEVVKLDQGAPRSPGWPKDGTPVAVIERGDGPPVEVEGDFAVKVTTAARSADFASPIRCQVAPGHLQIGETDRELTSFALADVQSVEVYRYKKTLTRTVVALGIGLGVLTFFLAGRHALQNSGPVK
jgi:hypothetical protein